MHIISVIATLNTVKETSEISPLWSYEHLLRGLQELICCVESTEALAAVKTSLQSAEQESTHLTGLENRK